MVADTCNPSTQRLRQEAREVEASLGFIARHITKNHGRKGGRQGGRERGKAALVYLGALVLSTSVSTSFELNFQFLHSQQVCTLLSPPPRNDKKTMELAVAAGWERGSL